ncbi:MAG: diguanylate cyclase, partial [bacterium]|nr:diguanylate cyclase [bacterium]
MPNTENTILENWLGPIESGLPNKTIYHFAVRQDGINLDFYLQRYFSDHKNCFHFFDCTDDLFTICQRYPIDAIVIGGKSDFMAELEMVRSIKQNVFLAMIPVILYHPDPDNSVVVAAFENGAEEFIHGEWVEKLVHARVRAVIERNRRDLSVNPSTCLPGTTIIEQEVVRQLEMQSEFALCYADLDNFKAYNDYYGYVSGDKVVKLTARILKDVVFDLCREGFVGHIAGDDYI